jgi:hypothetical protein
MENASSCPAISDGVVQNTLPHTTLDKPCLSKVNVW